MCRNIKTLFNFEPPASELEIRDASLQFVRKLSGFNVPSRTNEAAFDRAVAEMAESARRLIQSLVTNAEPKNREVEAMKARERSAQRFSGGPRVPCIEQYVKDHGTTAKSIPDAMYKFDFVSPTWSPDAAGLLLALSAVLFVLAAARILLGTWLKRYSS